MKQIRLLMLLLLSGALSPALHAQSADFTFTTEVGERFEAGLDYTYTESTVSAGIANSKKYVWEGNFFVSVTWKGPDYIMYKVTMDYLTLEISSPGNSPDKLDSRSARSSTDDNLLSLNNCSGKSIFVRVKADGDSAHMYGIGDLESQVMKLMPSKMDEDGQGIYYGLLEMITGNDGPFAAVRNSLQKSLKGSHNVGQTWSVPQEKAMPLSFPTTVNYKFESLDKDIAVVTMNGTGTSLSNEEQIRERGITTRKANSKMTGKITWNTGARMYQTYQENTTCEFDAVTSTGKLNYDYGIKLLVEYKALQKLDAPDWKEGLPNRTAYIQPCLKILTSSTDYDRITLNEGLGIFSHTAQFTPEEFKSSLWVGAAHQQNLRKKFGEDKDFENYAKEWILSAYAGDKSRLEGATASKMGEINILRPAAKSDSATAYGWGTMDNKILFCFRLTSANEEMLMSALTRLVDGIEPDMKYFPGADDYKPSDEELGILIKAGLGMYPQDDYLTGIAFENFNADWKLIPEDGFDALYHALYKGLGVLEFDANAKTAVMRDRSVQKLTMGNSNAVYITAADEKGKLSAALYRQKAGRWKKMSFELPEGAFFGILEFNQIGEATFPIVRTLGFRFFLGDTDAEFPELTKLSTNLSYDGYDCRCFYGVFNENGKSLVCKTLGERVKPTHPDYEAEREGFVNKNASLIPAGKRIFVSPIIADQLPDGSIVLFQAAYSYGKRIFLSGQKWTGEGWAGVDNTQLESLKLYKELAKHYAKISVSTLPIITSDNN